MSARKPRFRWEPLGVSEMPRMSANAWSKRPQPERAMRSERLLLRWWSRGIMAEAWDEGYEDGAEGIGFGDNQYRYDPESQRGCRSVVECFDGSKSENPFTGAKRRKR